MPRAARCHRYRLGRGGAFTLVELLVVVGVITVLIGLLLPALAGVVDRARDVKCQSNLRGIFQAMQGYAAENNGHFPWGLVNNQMIPGTWRPLANQQAKDETICWAALVGRYWNRNSPLVTHREERPIDEIRAMFPTGMNCPEAMQYRDHVVSYAMSLVAGAAPYMDIHLGGDTPPPIGALLRPTRAHQLRNDTAVLWDTALIVGQDFEPQWRMGADIDGQRIWQGAKTPQYRFYGARDPFVQIPPGNFAYDRPVSLSMPWYPYKNRETISEDDVWPYQGNLRFRHRKETTCNVAFGDGSVRQFTAKVNADRTVRQHDALRRYFMLRWPPGVEPDRTQPH